MQQTCNQFQCCCMRRLSLDAQRWQTAPERQVVSCMQLPHHESIEVIIVAIAVIIIIIVIA